MAPNEMKSVQELFDEARNSRPMGVIVTPGHQETFTDNSIATNNAIRENAVPEGYRDGRTSFPEIGEDGFGLISSDGEGFVG